MNLSRNGAANKMCGAEKPFEILCCAFALVAPLREFVIS
jgi:hypothetical protein